jgi:hypothetical protein
VTLCHADRRPRRIKPNDRRPKPSERLAQDASSASDVEDSQIAKAVRPAGITHELPASRISDIRDPDDIIFVRPPRDCAAVPPLTRQDFETRKLRRIDCTIDYHAFALSQFEERQVNWPRSFRIKLFLPPNEWGVDRSARRYPAAGARALMPAGFLGFVAFGHGRGASASIV